MLTQVAAFCADIRTNQEVSYERSSSTACMEFQPGTGVVSRSDKVSCTGTWATRRMPRMYIGAKDGTPNVPVDSGHTGMSFPSILATLVSAPESVLRRLIACDRDTPASELILLANDANLTVRLAVARRTSLPLMVFTVLIQDTSALIRRTIASRRDIPGLLLAALVEDEAISVRLKLAEHPSIDEETLEQLAMDAEPLVRLTVTARPMLSAALLERLAGDVNGAVRRASRKRLMRHAMQLAQSAD